MSSYISDGEEDDEQEITLIKSRSEANSPFGSEGESEEDSDAEFAVYPILRSLIKSKSAYTIPNNYQQKTKMKNSKTTFELSLSKTADSTIRSIHEEKEPEVVNIYTSLEMKWPEPDTPKRKKKDPPVQKRSGCWSSPPNILLDQDDLGSVISRNSVQECWSAPECDIEYSICSSSEDSEEETSKSIHFSQSYPAIIGSDKDVSVCSYRLPSGSSSATSPSPPRPLSPVLGKPAISLLRGSQSMNLPRKIREEDFLNEDCGSDDDELPQKEPWPEQEVWPEEEVLARNSRNGWVENSIPHSMSLQFAPRPRQLMQPSTSAHMRLFELHESSDRSSAHLHTSTQSEQSQLDESERVELHRRTAWVERGSYVHLATEFGTGLDWPGPISLEPNSSHQYHPQNNQGGMRRSFTTEEFRKGRRKLPRLPDELGGHMPTSVSMYDPRGFHSPQAYPESHFDYGRIHRETHSLQSSKMQLPPVQQPPVEYQAYRCGRVVRVPSRPPSSLRIAPPPEPIVPNQYSKQITKSDDPYAHIKTPMSPPRHLVSSPHSSTGRRLPAIPAQPSILTRLPPIQMSSPPQNEHTLCFIEGMTDSLLARSNFEDSYYDDDDTLNQNANFKKNRKSFFSPDDSSGVSSCTNSDSLHPTHRVQSAFVPRHSDELLLEIGDAIHVERSCEDHWSYGTNLRTGLHGIFPTAVICEIDLVEEICMGALPSNATKILTNERDTFYLTMLASIEVAHHKGNDTLIQAMNKVLALYKNREEVIVPQTVLMEISFRGVHVIDKKKKNFFQCPTFDFFYSLQNISFCGAHPKQLKYFGFITKHPILPRFACHVFMSNQSTQPIVEAIGRAFKRSYDEYMAFAHPTEDIYLE